MYHLPNRIQNTRRPFAASTLSSWAAAVHVPAHARLLTTGLTVTGGAPYYTTVATMRLSRDTVKTVMETDCPTRYYISSFCEAACMASRPLRKCSTFGSLYRRAWSRAVSPCVFAACSSAPRSSNICTTEMCPWVLAYIKAVSPYCGISGSPSAPTRICVSKKIGRRAGPAREGRRKVETDTARARTLSFALTSTPSSSKLETLVTSPASAASRSDCSSVNGATAELPCADRSNRRPGRHVICAVWLGCARYSYNREFDFEDVFALANKGRNLFARGRVGRNVRLPSGWWRGAA